MDKKTVIHKTISLYQNSGWKKFFAKKRFWYAPFVEIEQLLPKKGTIVDLGCGEGIFTNFIGLSSPERKVIGIEIDAKRFSLADKGIKNITFQLADITKTSIPEADAIILFHVLHHLNSYKDQELLLKKCIRQLKPNGKLLIVEIYIQPTVQYAISWITDHILVAWFFEKRLYTQILFRRFEKWIDLLKTLGVSCLTQYPNKIYKPFSNVIIISQKSNNADNKTRNKSK
jgi:2-polyprenyl-6-hydroxyphenyl methylase/3-demethylubiquinone-9 3-methyltransferase